jgi:uncharacterized membrane protein
MYQASEENTAESTSRIVTVSKLQVGFRIMADTIQKDLINLVQPTDSPADQLVFERLQGAVNILLQNAQFWSHVLASAQTVGSSEVGQQLFSQLSQQERNKIRAAAAISATSESDQTTATSMLSHEATYVVVTLLLYTADEQPLFEEIYSGSLLRDVLQEISLLNPARLQALDLLWSPVSAQEKLTEAELQLEYGDMVQIA